MTTARVDDDLKRRTDGLSVNWSEEIRKAIVHILAEGRLRDRIRAAQLTDRIRVTAPKGVRQHQDYPGVEGSTLRTSWPTLRGGSPPRGCQPGARSLLATSLLGRGECSWGSS